MNTFYPDVDAVMLTPLRSIFDQLLNDPLWLERPDCPYDEDTKSAIQELLVTFKAASPTKPGRPTPASAPPTDKFTMLSDELSTLFEELRDYSKNLAVDDTKDRMAYFRTATSLLDKITSLAERTHNVKAVSDFTNQVVAIFDTLLSPEDRTRAMEMLGK